MAHYRRGHKVPALPPERRLAAGLLTVVAVFVVVALTAWRPAVLAIPALLVVAAIGVFDFMIVTARGHEREDSVRSGRYASRPGATAAGPVFTVDPNAPTTAVPRLDSPIIPPDHETTPPDHETTPPGHASPPLHETGRPAGRLPDPSGTPRFAGASAAQAGPRPPLAPPPPVVGELPHSTRGPAEAHRRDPRSPERAAPRPAGPPTDEDVDMATMAIDMRAFLDP